MSDQTRPDELEGWGLRSRRAIAIGAGFFLFIAVTLAAMTYFYRALGAPHVNVRPDETFPAPELNGRLDSDPRWSFAPPNPFEHPPDPAVRAAMAKLAAEGDAGYAPLRPAP